MSRDKDYKCIYCGKYVSYKDLDEKKVLVNMTYETEYTRESCKMYHVKCKEKLK